MAKKKGKKRSNHEQSKENPPRRAIPGLSSICDVPSSSREPPTAAAGVNRQRQREETAAQLPIQTETSSPGRNKRDVSDSEVSSRPKNLDDPNNFGELRPSASESPHSGGPRNLDDPSSSREQTPSASESSDSVLPGGPRNLDDPSSSREQIPSASESSDSVVPGGPRNLDDPNSSREQTPSASEQSDLENSQQSRENALVPVMPRKPEEPGKLGRPISLISNLYPLKFSSCQVYHYDIEIYRLGVTYIEPGSGSSPDSSQYKDKRKKYKCLNTKLHRKVVQKLYNENFVGSFPVYDGKKNMYCVEQLPIGEEQIFEVRIEAENPGDPADPRGPKMDIFEVKIKPVRKKETGDNIISLEPLKALFRGETTSVPLDNVMVLETVLRYKPCLRFVPVGRNFFSPPNDFNRKPLGNGKEAWFGHHQSVRLAQTTAVVNLDTSASSFYEAIPMIEYIKKLTGKDLRRTLDDQTVFKIKKDIKNICVETTHQGYPRKYRIEGLSEESANKQTFELTVNNQVNRITVAHYYRMRYNIHLTYPHLHCLKVKSNGSFLPMEICKIVKGQHSHKELNPKQQAEMIKCTAKGPYEKFGEIDKIYRNSDYDNDPYLRKFGLQVLDEPLRVKGRTIEAPNLIYKSKQNSDLYRERPKNGAWNMMGKKFFTGTTINRWTLLSFAKEDECGDEQLQQFARALHKFANEQGVEMKLCSSIERADAQLQNVHCCIKEMKNKYKAELVFIVLPVEKRGGPSNSAKMSQILYSEVKRVAETTIGIVTQCVKGENVVSRGTNPSFVSNLCLKMNAKMGGVNNSMLPIEVSILPKEKILFVGVDVNHPAPTDNTCYSLAAAVGNVDTHPSRYAEIVRVQKRECNYKKMLEVIVNMREMVKYLLVAYYKNTKKMKPKKIIVYRDGVSEGQFSDVQDREIKAIREACASLEAGYEPGITFMVIQKRHHVRFLEERRGNPPAGTVVDTTVTHPLNYDFFLQSHNGTKGTSRSSYYTVLANDNKYGYDALQKMTYSLCHTYVRCTKSISLPAPVQYAHLAAYRARRHLNSHLMDLEARGKIERDDDLKFNIEIQEAQRIIDVLECMKNTMYYA